MGIKLSPEHSEDGFSLIEVMASLFVVSLILSSMAIIIQNALSINGKTNLRSNASSLAYKKVQDYVNTEFTSIPIGTVVNDYKVEDFSTEAQTEGLRNAKAKITIKPESILSTGSSTTSTNFAQTVSADTAYVAGSKINSVDQDDATGDWYQINKIRDTNYTNYTYSRYAGNPDNLATPSIDLGSAKSVDTLRINWYSCSYGANNFRIEAKNSSPGSNSGWTTMTSGLNDGGYPCSSGSKAQDISVTNATPYRYWRLFIIDASSSSYSVISELEAFSAGTPGSVVEQHGSSASSSPGNLYFSNSNLQMSEDGARGQQSIGMIFDGINANQGGTVNSAYLNFTAAEANSTAVTLRVKAVNTDSPGPWAGLYGVDKSVDSISNDGTTVGTTATTTWTPPSWSVNESGADTRVNVTTIVQELLNRVGWSRNNKMAFTVQYISGAGKRVASRSPAPQLQIDWSESVTTVDDLYVDNNGDGDVDNPTLLRLTALVEYEAYGGTHEVEYSTLIRRFGVGN